VFTDGFLVAVLVQISDEHEETTGMWFWIKQRLACTAGRA